MMVRLALLPLALLSFAAAVATVASGHHFAWPAIAYTALGVLLVVFERTRYRPKVDPRGTWRPTGERFTDPSSGEKVEVFYNERTGERDYRPLATP